MNVLTNVKAGVEDLLLRMFVLQNININLDEVSVLRTNKAIKGKEFINKPFAFYRFIAT